MHFFYAFIVFANCDVHKFVFDSLRWPYVSLCDQIIIFFCDIYDWLIMGVLFDFFSILLVSNGLCRYSGRVSSVESLWTIACKIVYHFSIFAQGFKLLVHPQTNLFLFPGGIKKMEVGTGIQGKGN